MPYTWDGEDLVIQLKVTPGASIEAFKQGDTQMRAWLHAQPQDGKANKQLVRLLSKQFRVAQSAIAIVKGETKPLKTVRISSPRQLPDFIHSP